MLSLQDLTVGQISGIIAAAVFIVQFLIPTAFPLVLLGLLRHGRQSITVSAASWSVIGRFLHSSHWPTILHTDTAAIFGVSKRITLISWLNIFAMVLIGIAAIVTPLGLYEDLVPIGAIGEPFRYIRDDSPMGSGTPPRSNTSGTWSRICWSLYPVTCPGSKNNFTRVGNETYGTVYGDGYDPGVPTTVVDGFQSGLSKMNKSVSGPFDIQWRYYTLSARDDRRNITINNGSSYTIGTFRQVSSFLLSNATVPVEGLVVDMKNGGIGFRNHTAPRWQPYGSTWTEDLLFVVPETQCVNTNLTLDFRIARTALEESWAFGGIGGIAEFNLTDHGGFSNLNRTYPYWDLNDTQNDPGLQFRAYKAAWINNAYSMVFMNITRFRNESDPNSRAFPYLKSSVGQQFPLMRRNDSSARTSFRVSPGELQIISSFGDYLTGTDRGGRNTSAGPAGPLYSNPFNINYTSWSDAELLCKGAGGGDLANITNIAATCGMLYGAPRRQDGSQSLLFDPGSAWTIPMYSCISVTKAMIKTATFRFNGSEETLDSLTVTDLTDKVYPDAESTPLWGVENAEMKLREGGPLWGMVTEEAAKKLNLSTIRKSSLYLPGLGSSVSDVGGSQNMPALDFHRGALAVAYEVSDSTASSEYENYSGRSNLAMYRLWQQLSNNTLDAAKILNLIWTDVAANSVVGTKSIGNDTAQAQDGPNGVPAVTFYERRIRFHYPYGIPAFLTLLMTLLVLGIATLFSIFGTARPSHMRTLLNETSTGRLLTPVVVPGTHGPVLRTERDIPAHQWARGPGGRQVTLGLEDPPRTGYVYQPVHSGGEEQQYGKTGMQATTYGGSYEQPGFHTQ